MIISIICCRIFDTSGQEVYDQIRKLSYNGTNVIFMAFSVVNRDSFENINKLWYPEKKKYMPRAKVMKWEMIDNANVHYGS